MLSGRVWSLIIHSFGVTLGALSVQKELANRKRHPTLEDDVTIYAGATILGGDTVIGKGAVIGGNCWVTSSVPPNSTVTLSRCRTIDNRQDVECEVRPQETDATEPT